MLSSVWDMSAKVLHLVVRGQSSLDEANANKKEWGGFTNLHAMVLHSLSPAPSFPRAGQSSQSGVHQHALAFSADQQEGNKLTKLMCALFLQCVEHQAELAC